MKNKLRIGFFMFILIVFSSLAYADYSSPVHVYDFDQDPSSADLEDQVGSSDSTSDTVNAEVSGINGNGWDFVASSSNKAVMPITIWNNKQAVTINCWFKADLNAGRDVIVDGVGGGETFMALDSGTHRWRVTTDITNEAEISGTTVSLGNWNMITTTYNGTHAAGYHNGTFVGVAAATGDTYVDSGYAFGSTAAGGQYFDGIIDECYIWDSALTPADISGLWNNGAGDFYPFSSPAVALNISMIDLANGSDILNFTAVIYNSTYSETVSTKNGSALFMNKTGFYNINISAYNYFNRTFLNVNTSSNSYQGAIYQAIFNINVTQLITNSTLTGFNATVGSLYNLTSTDMATFYLGSGDYTATVDKAGYYNKSISVSISALTNTTQTITGLYDVLFNVTAQDTTGSTVNIFTLNLTGVNNTYFIQQSTTNGTVHFPLITGFYNMSLDAENHTLKYNTTSINSTGKITSWLYTFTAEKMNSILFNIYNELTGVLVNTTVSIELISDNYSYNYSTSNGTKQVALLSPQNYTIRYGGTGFYTRNYYFQLLNRSINSLNLYLVNSSATEVTATVLDSSNFPVETAFIKVLKYDQPTNTFITREILETNFDGEAIAHIVLNDEYYKFIIEYQDETKLTTTKTQIYENSITFQINLVEETAAKYYTTAGIDYTLTFNNDTHTFNYVFNDKTNTIGGSCLKIYEMTHLGETLLNTTCVESPSGAIAISVTNETGRTYKATSYAHFSTYYYLDSLIKHYDEVIKSGRLGLFLLIIIQLVMVFVAAWDMTIMFIMLPIPATIGFTSGLIALSLPTLIIFWIASIFLAFIISSRN